MGLGFPRLLGDIGGTNARWAWQASRGAALQHIRTYPCKQFDSLEAVIRRYLADEHLPAPVAVAFGIATAITGDVIRMTNHDWSFSVNALRSSLGVTHCVLLNDFAAIAEALPSFTAEDLRAVGGGAAIARQPMAVLGAGTGLGVASVVWSADGRPVCVPGEGGHATLAATNAREAAVLDWLRARFGHASAERALSGPGLVNLVDALRGIDGRTGDVLQPADVTQRALAATDPDCVEALALFGGFLGNVAGNLALTVGARGGVFIGGGIVPRLGTAFDALPFRARFEDKGRFRGFLEQIPTSVIVAPAAGLYGAAAALEALTD